MAPATKAIALALFTVGYNILEGVVSVFAGNLADSKSLFGFGLDSFIESLSGGVIFWRFWIHGPTADPEHVAKAEKRATQLVACTFFVLGIYVLYDAGTALYRHERPDISVVGIVIACVSIIVMPVLFYLKISLGKSIGSPSLIADAKETLACVLLSVALLAGLGANYLWEIWWADSAAAIVIALLILREGYEILEELG